MLNDSNLARAFLKHSFFVILSLLALLAAYPTATNADTSQDANALYTWSAELVALDEAAGTITVKARVVNHGDVSEVARLEDGDRVTLTWSGLTWASGIRHITRATDTELDRFTMPVEFVASEMDDQYVSFRVPVPSEAAAKIKSVAPGQWVTVTSPHRPAGWKEAVVDIRPYNDVS